VPVNRALLRAVDAATVVKNALKTFAGDEELEAQANDALEKIALT